MSVRASISACAARGGIKLTVYASQIVHALAVLGVAASKRCNTASLSHTSSDPDISVCTHSILPWGFSREHIG